MLADLARDRAFTLEEHAVVLYGRCAKLLYALSSCKRAPLNRSPYDGSVIVAVACVRVVQVSGDEVVDVFPMRDRLVSAPCPVLMIRTVIFAAMAVRARAGLVRKHVLVDVVAVNAVQMAVVQIVDVVVVPDPCMPAAVAVHVIMIGMRLVFHDITIARSPRFARPDSRNLGNALIPAYFRGKTPASCGRHD